MNTTDDELNTDGDCSLREAILSADTNTRLDACNAGSGNDTIIVPSGTYTPTIDGTGEDNTLTGDLDINRNSGLTIQGAGVSSTIIDGGGIDRIFDLPNIDSTAIIKNLTIRHGSIPEGMKGGGILNQGILTLDNVLVDDNIVHGGTSANTGGGVCNGCGKGQGQLILIDSTISNNQADRGGAIFSNNMTNSTVSNNNASGNSTNIRQETEAMTITNSTISNNIDQSKINIRTFDGSVTLVNTIVYSSQANYNCYSSGTGTITSLGHNLDNGNSCGFTYEGDLSNTDPLLGPLADNGGDTLTHALLSGSPAIDAGSNAFCPPTDQWGIPRPFGSGCDIGAYE